MNDKPDLHCISGPRETGTSANANGKLPAALTKARRTALEQLQGLLVDVFDNADDTLFDYAEKAVSDSDKNLYLETMRQLRLNRKQIERDFFVHINGLFKQLACVQSGPEVELEAVASLDELSLVENDDLEMSVALEGMSSKAKSKFGDRIYQLNTRLDTLLLHVTVGDKNNPLHPIHICEAFCDASKVVECNIKIRLVLFKLFDRFVISNFDLVLDAANTSLAQAGILPDLKGSPSALRPRRQSGETASQSETSSPKEAAKEAASEFFDQLQTLLASTRDLPMMTDVISGPIGSPAQNARVVSNNELFDLLTQIQQVQPAGEDVFSGRLQTQRFDVRQAVARVLQQREAESGPERVDDTDSDVINLVSMLFDFILDDENLPVPVKALLGRLQIPYLKLAVQDYGFFNRGGHPARKLLNELARAGIGLNDNVDQLQKDMVFKKIQAVVQQVLKDFKKDASLFAELQQEFSNFMQTEVRRSQMIEQRTKSSEEGKAKAEQAEKVALETVRKRLDGKVVPEVVVRLLTDGWLNVLKLIFLKYGPESNNWVGAVRTIDHLLFSVQPPEDELSRKKLFNVVPVLLKNLRQGLNTVSYNPFELGEMLTQLEQVQMQILRGETPDHLEDKAVDPAKELVQAVTQDMERMGASPVAKTPVDNVTPIDTTKVVASSSVMDIPPLLEDDPYLQQAKEVQVGTWMEFCNDQGVKTRSKLAAHIKSADKLIFVNRTGVKIDEKSTMGFAHALRGGDVIILEDSQLFDRALQNVIGNLRKVKQANH